MIKIFVLPSEYGLLTLDIAKALSGADAVVLQSKRNSTAERILAEYHKTYTLDEAFEQAEDFDSLYELGAQKLLELEKQGELVFGIIGDVYSNGFVEKLGNRAEISLLLGVDSNLQALRLAEQQLGALGSYTVVEAREIANMPINTSQALLVCGVDNLYTASDLKLALGECYGDEFELVLVKCGFAEKISLSQIDKIGDYGDGAYIVLPKIKLIKKYVYNFYDLVEIMKILRGKNGCPWDREQTHKTLRQYLLEESYEVMDAIDAEDMPALYDELGDVLLQVVFHAEIARQCGEFAHTDVTNAVCTKMINRHPHIFADGSANTADAVVAKWEEIKRQEKGNKSFVSVLEDVPKTMGSMMRAYKLQKKAGAIGFDWENAVDAYKKVMEEAAELEAELANMDEEKIEQEAGDLLFAIINVLRKFKINPEVALTRTCEKFIKRFEYMEGQAGESLMQMSLEEMDKLWNRAKEDLKLLKNPVF